MGCASSGPDWLNIPEDMNGWLAYDAGCILCGPGSYYQDFASLHINVGKELDSLGAAWEHIRQLTKQNPQNPPVMWQLVAPKKMVVHLQAFLKLNRDNDTGKSLAIVKDWDMLCGKKKPKAGSPVFYCPSLNVELDSVDWSRIPADMIGWCMHESGCTATRADAQDGITLDGIPLEGDGPEEMMLKMLRMTMAGMDDITGEDPHESQKRFFIEPGHLDPGGPLRLNSPEAAWRKIRELKDKNPQNPPVAWQMARPGKMLVHLNENYETKWVGYKNVRGIPSGYKGNMPFKRDVKQSLDLLGGNIPVGGSPFFYFSPSFELGGSILTLLDDAKMLEALQDCLATNPTWLGKGRDVSSAAPEEAGVNNAECVSGVYSKLKLMRAWKVGHDVEEGRYKLAKQELEQQLKGLQGRTPCNLNNAKWASSLGVSLDPKLNEGLACHGTKLEALAPILSSGLNERYSSGAFGDGTYLAEDAGKADQYCEVDAGMRDCALHKALYPGGSGHPGNVCYLLVCQVLLGEPAITFDGVTKHSGGELWVNSNTRRELVAVPGSDPPFAHHSLLVEKGKAVKRYRELVLPHSDRVLVKYLIAYQRQP